MSKLRISIILCAVLIVCTFITGIEYALTFGTSESGNTTDVVGRGDITVSDPNGTALFAIKGVEIVCIQNGECMHLQDDLCRELGLFC